MTQIEMFQIGTVIGLLVLFFVIMGGPKFK